MVRQGQQRTTPEADTKEDAHKGPHRSKQPGAGRPALAQGGQESRVASESQPSNAKRGGGSIRVSPLPPPAEKTRSVEPYEVHGSKGSETPPAAKIRRYIAQAGRVMPAQKSPHRPGRTGSLPLLLRAQKDAP